MKLYSLLTIIIASLFWAGISHAEEERYNKPFIPLSGDKVLLDKEFVIGSEKVFMTFIAPKKMWNALPVINLQNEASFTFTYKDAFKRALSFDGNNPSSNKPSKNKPISSELISIERITAIETQEDLSHLKGRYYYYVHILQTYPSPAKNLPKQPTNTYIIVLSNGWATYPMFQFMKVEKNR